MKFQFPAGGARVLHAFSVMPGSTPAHSLVPDQRSGSRCVGLTLRISELNGTGELAHRSQQGGLMKRILALCVVLAVCLGSAAVLAQDTAQKSEKMSGKM